MANVKLADELESRLRRVFKPDEGGDVVSWLEANIKQIPFSPMPAGFRAKETPWLIEPLRACADPEKRLVQIIAPIQSGKSLLAEMLSCYILARQPAPTLYLNDTNDNAADWMKTRLRVLWENCPPVMSKLPKGEEKSKSDTVQTNDMTFWCLGAYNEKNLQRRSIRWLLADETWLYPKGHLAEASARVTSFGWLGKRIFMSQGGFAGDETEEFWATTDRRVWSFACPHCDHRQEFKWSQIRIPEDAMVYEGEFDYNKIRENTTYECEGCKHNFKDSRASRDEMNSRGFYAVTNPNAADYNAGYTWNCLAARSWGMAAEAYTRAKIMLDYNGDAGPMRIFRQKQLAEFWTDEPDSFDSVQSVGEYKQGEDWDDEALINPKTKKIHSDKTLKDQVFARFMTVDVQRNGFYCLVRSWAEGGYSRLRAWKFVSTWNDVAAFQKIHSVHNALVYVDCGDQFDDVIRQCGINKWTALRGDQRSEFPWRIQMAGGYKTVNKTYAPARLVNAGTGVVRVHHFSNLALKDQLSRIRKTGKHMCPHDCGQDYMDQMESEARVMGNNGKPEWRRIGKRANHLWDCEVMQLIASAAFGFLGAPKPVEETHTESSEESSNEDSPVDEGKSN
jgi:phage terminase large subunit GpA-like protein